MKIVGIGAHPDDVEIFFYGFLAACKARGDDISIGVATDGAAGGDNPGAELAATRAKETANALGALAPPMLLGLPDGGLVDAAGARAVIGAYLRDCKPDLVVTHAPDDYHPDHRALSHYVTDAVGFTCPILFAETLMGVGFTPDFYVDITPFFAAKQAAIMAHDSQEPERFAAASALMNRFRAAQCNAPDGHYAEAYRMASRFPFTDIREMLPAAPAYRPFYVTGSDALI